MCFRKQNICDIKQLMTVALCCSYNYFGITLIKARKIDKDLINRTEYLRFTMYLHFRKQNICDIKQLMTVALCCSYNYFGITVCMLYNMAIMVMEFQVREYKIRNIFAYKSTCPKEITEF